ncbi:MAG: hypothetical protein O8C64_07630 [Candidatus Methanoperedens sp.]|nr:hypothetical protein [Candidatus Methanoperedens sp.]
MPGLYSFQIEDNENTPFNDLDVIKEYSVKQPLLVGPTVGRLSTRATTLTITTNGSAEALENVTYDFMNIQFLLAPTKEIYKYVPADFQVVTTANPNVGFLLPITMSVTTSPFGPYKAMFLMVPVLQYPTAPAGEEWFYPVYTYTDNPAFKEYLQHEWNTDTVELAEIDTKQNIYNDTERNRCTTCHVGVNRIVEDFATLKDSNGTLMKISGKSKDGRNAGTIPVQERFIHSIYHDADKNNLSVMQVDRSHTEMQALEPYDVTVKKNSRIWELIGGNDPGFCKNCHKNINQDKLEKPEHSDNQENKDEIEEHKSSSKQKNSIEDYYPHVIRSVSEVDIKENQLQYLVPRTQSPLPISVDRYNLTFMDSQVFEVPVSTLRQYVPSEFSIFEIRPGVGLLKVTVNNANNTIWGPLSNMQFSTRVEPPSVPDTEHYYIPYSVENYYVIGDYIDNDLALEASQRLGYNSKAADISYTLQKVDGETYELATTVKDGDQILYSLKGRYNAIDRREKTQNRFMASILRQDVFSGLRLIPSSPPEIYMREGSMLSSIAGGDRYVLNTLLSGAIKDFSGVTYSFRYRTPELTLGINPGTVKLYSTNQTYNASDMQYFAVPTSILSKYVSSDMTLVEVSPGIGVVAGVIYQVNSSPYGPYNAMCIVAAVYQPKQVVLPEDPPFMYHIITYTDNPRYYTALKKFGTESKLVNFTFNQTIKNNNLWNMTVIQDAVMSDENGPIYTVKTKADMPYPEHVVHYLYKRLNDSHVGIVRMIRTQMLIESERSELSKAYVRQGTDLWKLLGYTERPYVVRSVAQTDVVETTDFFYVPIPSVSGTLVSGTITDNPDEERNARDAHEVRSLER